MTKSFRDVTEFVAFEGDYSGREWLQMSEKERDVTMIEARKTGAERRKCWDGRSTMTHREARDHELAGHKIQVLRNIVVLDDIRYELI